MKKCVLATWKRGREIIPSIMYIGELSKQAILYDGLDMANGHRKRSSQVLAN